MSEPSEMEKEDEPEIQEVDETEEVAVDEGTAPKTPSRRVHGIWEHFEDSPKDKKYVIHTRLATCQIHAQMCTFQ